MVVILALPNPGPGRGCRTQRWLILLLFQEIISHPSIFSTGFLDFQQPAH
jgi:hypothetical protein